MFLKFASAEKAAENYVTPCLNLYYSTVVPQDPFTYSMGKRAIYLFFGLLFFQNSNLNKVVTGALSRISEAFGSKTNLHNLHWDVTLLSLETFLEASCVFFFCHDNPPHKYESQMWDSSSF